MKQSVETALNMLFIEDDKYFRIDMAKKLEKYGSIDQADNLESALNFLKVKQYDVAFIDLDLSGKNEGLEIIKETSKRKVYPIVLTGNSDPEMVAEAYKLNCRHYFTKIEFQKNVEAHIGSYLNAINSSEIDKFFQTDFITQDKVLKNSIKLIGHQNLARDQRIFITGPTGVGKSQLAKFIHLIAEGTKENFIHVNLSELQENLVESHLFGHRKGAFTGATSDRDGLFNLADGGTLFLDEIGTIPLYLQKKLLKVLQEKEFNPLGSSEVIKSDFRLISATCDDIGELIDEKTFRTDLYFRLKGIEIEITPLKDRRFDVLPLIDHFMSKSARKIHITKEAKETLFNYDWYGNVRELQDLVMKLTRSHLGLVDKIDLPEYIVRNKNPFKSSSYGEQKLYSKTAANFISKHGLKKYIEQIENEAFKDFWNKTEGKVTKTFDCLQISKGYGYGIKERLESSGDLNGQ